MRSPIASQRRLWLILGLLVAVGAATALWHNQTTAQQPRAEFEPVFQANLAPGMTAGENDTAIAKAESLSRAFRAAAKKVVPTVVKIKTVTQARRLSGDDERFAPKNPFQGTPFEDFFDDEFQRNPREFRMPRREGLGSGVIINPKGLILTNNHVVEGADKVLVETADGRQFEATDIKTDPESDLAVLRISAPKPLPAAAMGDSDAMEIGDWVLAVGNPFELELTVSAGIISGKGRSLASSKRAEFLQTDAAINPGNSGGPLVNLNGEVVGINTAIASNNGGYQGVGFAIPINLAKWVTEQLIQRGGVQRAYLGVAIAEVDARVAAQLGVTPNRGVLVTDVYPDTPASKAGFEPLDVILSYAGRAIGNPRELQEVVERSPAGSRQTVNIVRGGEAKTLRVVVKPLPGDFGVATVPSRPREKEESSGFKAEELGLEVSEMTEEVAKRLGYDRAEGVLITDVDPDGIAAAAGLSEGMLILRVRTTRVNSVAEFEAALKKESLAKGILLLIGTPGGNRGIVLQRS